MPQWRIIFICSIPMFLAGCATQQVDRRLRESSSVRESELNTLLYQIETEPRQKILWKQAHARMSSDNLGLQQSRKMLEDAQKLTRRQWLSLVPRTAGYLNISQNIASITDFDGDDLNASLIASFNIPNPFDFHAMLYGAALQEQNARWSSQLDERRAFSELYSAFMDARMLREEEAATDTQLRSLLKASTEDIADSIGTLAARKTSIKRRRQTHRASVNRLLNTPGSNWDLAGDLPEISYRNRYQTVKIGKDFGKLALNLYAIQIESAILQTQRVKFQQWPVISFGLSNPPLYTTNGDNQISGEDFVMFSGASKSFDLTDLGGRESIRDAEYRLKITRQQLKQNMEREALRMIQIRDAYGQLLEDESRIMSAMRRLNRPATSAVNAILSDLDLFYGYETQLIQQRRQIKQLELQYLIWDERYW